MWKFFPVALSRFLWKCNHLQRCNDEKQTLRNHWQCTWHFPINSDMACLSTSKRSSGWSKTKFDRKKQCDAHLTDQTLSTIFSTLVWSDALCHVLTETITNLYATNGSTLHHAFLTEICKKDRAPVQLSKPGSVQKIWIWLNNLSLRLLSKFVEI